MKKQTKDSIVNRIKREQKIIADARDRLRDIVGDAQQLLENCEMADEALNEAVDLISQTV